MGKVRTKYRGFTPTMMKTKADIPATATDITVNANDIDCVNIKMSDVKTVIGASTYSLMNKFQCI